jgi:outer membrane protein assembly factor BamB
MVCKGMTERYHTLRQCARGAGFVALVFSLTVAALLAADWTRSGQAETVRSEVLAQALANGRAAPQDQQAVTFAREMDLLARRAYFNSLTFRQGGMALLVLGLVLTAGCFGAAWRLSLQIPDPRSLAESDPARTDRLTVTAVLASGVVLLLAAAALEARHGRRAAPAADRALRARLTNPALKPGEVNVCPCRKGTKPEALEGQWPFLRGPTFSGRASFTNAPVTWNGEKGEGIKWKVALARGGSSTPVVWGQRLFLTAGDARARTVMAHDAETGNLLWSTDVPDGAKAGEALPEVGEEVGFAASTPACDEARVYAVFGTGDLVALNHDGKIVWQVYVGRPQNTYGHASSLVYCGEMLLVQWDQEEKAKILALDKNTGKTLWETPREVGMSWSTPVLMPSCDKYVLLVHASQQTWGMELATGKKLWQVEAVTGEVAPSLAWEGDVWLAANCYSKMIAFKLPPEGAPQKLWEWEDGNLPDVASPVVADGLIYLVTDAGEVRCHGLTDGKEVWHKEFEEGFYASPVIAGDRLYVVDRVKGVFRVFATGREGKELSANPMGDAVSATPAFANGRIYARGHKNLWCVERR